MKRVREPSVEIHAVVAVVRSAADALAAVADAEAIAAATVIVTAADAARAGNRKAIGSKQ